MYELSELWPIFRLSNGRLYKSNIANDEQERMKEVYN
jgi:hypothetical protein